MSFYEFYNTVQESMEDFYVGKIRVRLIEVSEEVYNLSEADERIPGNMATLGRQANPNSLDRMDNNPLVGKSDAGKAPLMAGDNGTQFKKFRATYQINDHPITNYLTAMNKNEAKRMLFDYLEKLGNPKQRAVVANTSEIVPVDNWNELIKLLQYSMKWDRKNASGKTSPFQSLDAGDFHLMLSMVNKHPNFVKSHLIALPQEMQFYFKRAYNGLSKRDLDKDLNDSPHGSYWGNQVKDMVGNFGSNIRKKLAGVKTRNSPNALPAATDEMPPALGGHAPAMPARPSLPQPPNQGTLGTDDEEDSYRPTLPGMMPKPTAPQLARQPFWR